VIPLASNRTLPRLPPGGIHAQDDLRAFPVAQASDGFM
jgi:hypothetical protein